MVHLAKKRPPQAARRCGCSWWRTVPITPTSSGSCSVGQTASGGDHPRGPAREGPRKLKTGFDVVLLDFSLPDSFGLDTFPTCPRGRPEDPDHRPHQPRRRRARGPGGPRRCPGLPRQTRGRHPAAGALDPLRHRTPDRRRRAPRQRGTLRPRGAGRQRRSLGLGPRGRPGLLLSALEDDARFRDHEVGDSPREWFERIHPDDRPPFRRHLDAHLEGETEHFQFEHRMRNAAGGSTSGF